MRLPYSSAAAIRDSQVLTVNKLIPAGQGLAAALLRRAAAIELPWEVRQRSRFEASGPGGVTLRVFLPRGTVVRGGDVLLAADGSLHLVRAAAEPVLAVQPCGLHGTPLDLVRAAYHLGNRHVQVDLRADRLLIEPDHVLAAMLRRMHLVVTEENAPFEPEGGAYAEGAGRGHSHGGADDQGHGHSHGPGDRLGQVQGHGHEDVDAQGLIQQESRLGGGGGGGGGGGHGHGHGHEHEHEHERDHMKAHLHTHAHEPMHGKPPADAQGPSSAPAPRGPAPHLHPEAEAGARRGDTDAVPAGRPAVDTEHQRDPTTPRPAGAAPAKGDPGAHGG